MIPEWIYPCQCREDCLEQAGDEGIYSTKREMRVSVEGVMNIN